MGDMVDYENLKRQEIKRLMAFPFYRQGRIAGYLGGDNFEVTDQFNTAELLATLSFFWGPGLLITISFMNWSISGAVMD